MPTVTLLPTADAGPNDGTATPAGAHYLNVDDDPNDGDTSFLTLGFIGFTEVFRMSVSAIPDGSIITALRVRWAAKGGASPATGQAGIRIDGTYYFGAPTGLPAIYTAFDQITTHPDGDPWTKDRIAAAYGVIRLASIDDDTLLPRPRFTELVFLADILPPAERPTARDTAIAPLATESGISGSATAAALAPSASERAMAVPDAVAVAMAGSASESGIAGSSIPAAIVGTGAISGGPGKPTAIPSAMDPSATPTAIRPSATASAVRGSGSIQ